MFDKIGKGLLDLWATVTTPQDTGADGTTGASGAGKSLAGGAAKGSARVMTPERAELIRNAMRIHRAKQKVLADLDDKQRQKLVLLAMRAFLNEGREPPPRAGGSSNRQPRTQTSAGSARKR